MKFALVSKKDISLLVILLIWICAIIFVVSYTLATTVSVAERRIPVYSVETENKELALTFNCAWDDNGLDELLELLRQEEIRCTFFFVGDFAEKHQGAVRKIYNHGHEIGNHSMKHIDPTKQTYEEILSDISSCNELLYSITGNKPLLYRAPSGAYDNKTLEAAESLGMTVIQWDADSIDWKDISPEKIISRVTEKVTNGSIVLFHLGRQNTLDALPEIISTLKSRGYSFCAVGDMLLQGDYYTDHSGRIHISRSAQREELY